RAASSPASARRSAPTEPSPVALAFLGDAVWSRCVRLRLLRQGTARGLHEASQAYVTCEAQAQAYRRLLPRLTAEEADLCRRAYNSPHLTGPRHAKGAAYHAATALEALFGWLCYRGDEARAELLFDLVTDDPLTTDTEKTI
ncbi:MAG: hypothetical protein J6125_01660, partial [Clostridia bacterium]|nr:hypothetical protein [Clostridia bacterium]